MLETRHSSAVASALEPGAPEMKDEDRDEKLHRKTAKTGVTATTGTKLQQLQKLELSVLETKDEDRDKNTDMKNCCRRKASTAQRSYTAAQSDRPASRAAHIALTRGTDQPASCADPWHRPAVSRANRVQQRDVAAPAASEQCQRCGQSRQPRQPASAHSQPLIV